MKVEIYEDYKTITPSEGMYLTQSTEVAERIFSDGITCPLKADESAWREATEEEKVAYEAEAEKRMEAELNAMNAE